MKLSELKQIIRECIEEEYINEIGPARTWRKTHQKIKVGQHDPLSVPHIPHDTKKNSHGKMQGHTQYFAKELLKHRAPRIGAKSGPAFSKYQGSKNYNPSSYKKSEIGRKGR